AQPGADTGLPLKPFDAPIQFQKRLLDGVFGVLPITQNVVRQALQPRAVTPVNLFERTHFAPPAGCQQFGLAFEFLSPQLVHQAWLDRFDHCPLVRHLDGGKRRTVGKVYTGSMKRFALIPLVFLASCAKQEAPPAAAELPHAAVVLRDGTRVTGAVAASTPAEITLNLDAGGSRTIAMNDVRRVDYGDTATNVQST